MDWTSAWQAAVMGVVEGITEFLPISSTGHLILTAAWLDFWTEEKRAVFEVAIQLGAILSVCYEYRARLWGVATQLGEAGAQRFVINILVAFMPAAGSSSAMSCGSVARARAISRRRWSP